HVLLYDDRTDIYLFDNRELHKEAFVFEDANPNRHKGYNEAVSKTFAGAQPWGGAILVNMSSILRTLNNITWKTFDFNTCSAYGQSIPWVGNPENDNIEAVFLNKNTGSERPHFMGCEHANWGGQRIYITLTSNNPNGKYAYLGWYHLSRVWYNPFTWGWRYWDNRISSYEMFQTNVKLYGIQI
ncbi:MAG: hypothetical protein ACOVOQ_15730, partial [Flavobacterium sp.]